MEKKRSYIHRHINIFFVATMITSAVLYFHANSAYIRLAGEYNKKVMKLNQDTERLLKKKSETADKYMKILEEYSADSTTLLRKRSLNKEQNLLYIYMKSESDRIAKKAEELKFEKYELEHHEFEKKDTKQYMYNTWIVAIIIIGLNLSIQSLRKRLE